jgi:hypothetical protein
MVFVPSRIKHFGRWLVCFRKLKIYNKPSAKELAQRFNKKHVRFATHARPAHGNGELLKKNKQIRREQFFFPKLLYIMWHYSAL